MTLSRVTPTGWIQESGSISRVTPSGWLQESQTGGGSSSCAIAATTSNAVGSSECKVSPITAISATTANVTAAWTSTTGSPITEISATTGNSVGSITSVGDTSSGTITSEALRDNTGTIIASKSLNFVAVYNDTTGALVVRKTGISTNSSGIFTVVDAAITAGTTYRLDWEDADGKRRMPRKAAT